MADIAKAAQEIAGKMHSVDTTTPQNLEKGEREVGQMLSQYAQQLSRDDFRSLVKAVGQQENKDGKGLDLVFDDNALPRGAYAVLPHELAESAKKMAGLMDSPGHTADAVELLSQTEKQIDDAKNHDPAAVQREFSLWSIAVDAFDKKGVGSDVSIDLRKPGLTGIEWNFEQVQPKK